MCIFHSYAITKIKYHKMLYKSYVENKPNLCVSCNKKLKFKKQWDGPVFYNRYSFLLNDYICVLALRRWQLSWSIENNSRICLTCKNKERVQTTGKNRGRTKVNEVGFVTVCSKCHSEVKITYKKHLCTSYNEIESYLFSKQKPRSPIFLLLLMIS